MKKALSVLLTVLLLAACIPTAVIGSAETESIWSKRVALSDGATLSEADCSLTAGSEATFKVTLPAGGYAQFQQKLSDFFGDAAFFNTNYVKVVVGDGKKATYNTSDLYVQLTSSADASKDIVPVDEPNGADPGTDGLTWHLYGPNADDPGTAHAYGLNNGSSTYKGAQFTYFGLIESHNLMVSFTKESDGKVTVNQRYGNSSPNQYANRQKASTKTLAEIGGEDGVYVRIRNGEDKEQTYTVTIYSSDVYAGYRDGDFILSDEGSTIDSVEYAVDNGVATIKYTATLSGTGSYVQLDKKLATLISDDDTYYVGVGVADFASAKFWTQLTSDATAAKDITPVSEYTTTPGTNGVTYFFMGHNNNVIIGRGLNTAGFGSTVTSVSNLASNPTLVMRFRNHSGKVGIKVGAVNSAPGYGYEKYDSARTIAETGLTDGAYLRIRNGIASATTYTVTIKTKATPYTDGVWKFSDEGSSLLSTSRVINAENMVEETATVMLSGNGGYVQLDRLLKDIITKDAVGKAQVKVIVGDGTADDYANTNVYFQLTADKDATKDIVPVDEKNGQSGGADPGTDGITWRVIKEASALYLRNGGSGGAYQGTYGVLSNAPSHGLPVKFTLDSATGKVSVNHRYYTASGYANKGKPSTKTLAQIGGENGVYVRIRNGQTTSQKYTIVYTYENAFADTVENGTVTLDKAAALTGDAVKATVTANEGYQLKAGSLKYTVDGTTYYPITARVGADESVSNVFAFAMPEDAVNVTAEFVAADAANHALLGAAYNIENGKAGKDMRFGSRAYRKAGDRELISCGNYLLRADSVLGAALTDGVALDDAQLEELVNPSEGQVVKRIPTSVLNDRCDDYVDYTVRIVGVAESYGDVAYVCVSYANYRDAEGNVETVYSVPCIRSYNQLIEAAQ